MKISTHVFKTLISTTLLVASSALFAQQGVSDRDITIGQFAAITGPAAQLGLRMQAGIKAQFDAVNKAGGINGRQIKLVTRDDGYEPEKSAQAVKALINEDKVFALVGSVGTPTTLAALPAINEEKIPLIGPSLAHKACASRFRASFSTCVPAILTRLTASCSI